MLGPSLTVKTKSIPNERCHNYKKNISTPPVTIRLVYALIIPRLISPKSGRKEKLPSVEMSKNEKTL